MPSRIPEGEEKEQDIENLFEKVMTECIPNSVREKVIQVQEAHRVPIKMNPKRPTPRHSIIKMAKCKDKENLKGSKGETASKIQGISNKAARVFLNRNTTNQKGMARNILSNEKQRPATATTLSSKALI